MNPIEFREQNVVYRKPDSMTDEECSSLPICKVDDMLISCWKLSWRERLRALFFGKVWLGVLGHGHPPVWLECSRTGFGYDPNEGDS